MYELHVHLDGSIRRKTFLELAKLYNIDVKSDFGFRKGMSLLDALGMFHKTVAVMKDMDNITRITSELCDDLKNDGVEYAEIRFAPQLHAKNIDMVIDAAHRGLKHDFNLILCGLYGEHPSMLENLVEIGKNYKSVVGIDIAGAPQNNHKYGLLDYKDVFVEAKNLGFGTTAHVSEGRDAIEIWQAITYLEVTRLGHATTLLETPWLVEVLRDKNVTIEACVTSNVQTGLFYSASEHPIKKWIELDIPVAICADNTLMSKITTSQEIEKLKKECGLTKKHIDHCFAAAKKSRFY